MANKGFTLWFTGLSGAGKTTLAQHVSGILLERGLNVEILDGDVVRQNLSKGLGFSKEDRDTNIRRIGFVCNLLTRNGVAAIAAAISPYKAIRDENREMIGNFIEVYCECPIEVLTERDVKGLYAKALKGEIKGFRLHCKGIGAAFPGQPSAACSATGMFSAYSGCPCPTIPYPLYTATVPVTQETGAEKNHHLPPF